MPICELPSCNNEVQKTKRGQWKKHCSIKCKVTHNSILGAEKRKATCLERYGSTTNLTHETTKQKTKNTLLEKYGVEHPMDSTIIKEKLKNTVFKNHGVKNVSELDSVKKKKIDSYIQHYGVEHPLQSAEVQERRKINSIKKYGVDHYSKTPDFKADHPNQSHILPDNFKKLKNPDWLIENEKYPCSYLAEILGVTKDTVAKSYRRFGIKKDTISSHGEISILEIIKQNYDGEVIKNCRNIISPLELDIFLPDKKIAFEYDGIFWHSELNGKDKNYHLNKTKLCENLGIRLIHIFENEWEENKNIVKSRIENIFGNSKKIGARRCSIVELSTVEERLFFSNNHIQGYAPSSLCYGLMHEDELVAAMSFVKSRFDKKIEWELLRYANKCHSTVVGGASRLFNVFVNNAEPMSVISYSDKRWNTGNLYNSIGFSYSGHSSPNYRYTKNYKMLESRIKYQKHKLKTILENFDNTKTEWENMIDNGFDRIWDCGNDIWKWKRPLSF